MASRAPTMQRRKVRAATLHCQPTPAKANLTSLSNTPALPTAIPVKILAFLGNYHDGMNHKGRRRGRRAPRPKYMKMLVPPPPIPTTTTTTWYHHYHPANSHTPPPSFFATVGGKEAQEDHSRRRLG